MYVHEEEDRYRGLVNQLSERLSREDPDEHFRRAVRREVDKRMRLYLGPLALIAALWWVYPALGLPGVGVVLAIGAGAVAWELIQADHDPAIDRHLSVVHAEDLLRLTIVADGHAAGERVWVLGDKHYPSNKPSLVASGGKRWDGSWKQIHDWALEFEKLSPKARRIRLIEASRRAQPALEQGEAMAASKDAELTLWARDYLHKLRQTGERGWTIPILGKKS